MEKRRGGGLAACLAKFKRVSVIGGMFMLKMNDLFSPLLFLTNNTPGCVTIFFLKNRKGGGYLTRTTGKRDTGCLASQLKGVW
jgi:hypothetical protein